MKITNYTASMTPTVRMTVSEFKSLYYAASVWERMLLLMGLFTGLHPKELAEVRRDQFDLGTATFTHRRRKSGQWGRFWLPPELVATLAAYWREHPSDPEGLAFRTPAGKPLMTGTRNSLPMMLRRLLAKAEVERPGICFGSLRMLLAEKAANRGESVMQAALMHRMRGVLAGHLSHSALLQKVAEVGKAIHAELRSAGVFDVPGSKAVSKQATRRQTELAKATPDLEVAMERTRPSSATKC